MTQSELPDLNGILVIDKPAGMTSHDVVGRVRRLVGMKRVGHGVRDFDNYRLRLLLAVGLDWRTVHWQAAPATPIRGRSPRLVASSRQPIGCRALPARRGRVPRGGVARSVLLCE